MTGKTKKPRKQWRRPYRPNLIDLAILGVLPDEGTRLGLHEIGMTTKGILDALEKKYGADAVTHTQISGRVIALKANGYAKGVILVPTSQGHGWQVTEAGKKLLADHKHELSEVK